MKQRPLRYLFASAICVLLLTSIAARQSTAATITIDGAGFAFEHLNVDITELNEIFSQADYPSLNERILLHGVTASGQLLDHFSYFAIAAGNAMTSTSGDKISKFSFSYGGVAPIYEFISEDRYSISAGLLLSGGRATLMMLSQPSTNFEESIAQPRQTVLRRSFISLKPQLTARAKITDWLNLDLVGGYLFVVGGDWEQHGNVLPGPPQSLNSLTLQATLELNWARSESAE